MGHIGVRRRSVTMPKMTLPVMATTAMLATICTMTDTRATSLFATMSPYPTVASVVSVK